MGRNRRTTIAPPASLELEPDTMGAMVELTMDRIQRHLATLDSQPMHAVAGKKKLARALREPMPEDGVAFERLLRLLFGRVIPASLNTASPGYLAYIPGGGIFHAAVADLIANATNRYVGVWQAAPLLTEIEANVIRWFASMLGLPDTAGGVLTTGGSLANLFAVIAARRLRLPEDFSRGVAYTSDQAHHSVLRAAVLAGVPAGQVREIESDASLRLDAARLDAAMHADRAAGRVPFLVVASAGTTNTGAVDDLGAVAEVAARHGAWFHVDAAYGGFFALTERGRRALAGIERADSVTLDPHKSLFLPYGTGCLLARDRDDLRRAFAHHANYLPPMQSEPDLFDFCDMSPELSRDARGLRVWLPLKMHGAGTFRAALDEKLDLARHAADALRAMPELEIVAEPQLSLFAFRVRPPAGAGADAAQVAEERTRRLLVAVNARQRVLLTGAVVRGRFVARICVLSFRTHASRIEACIDDVRAGLREILDG
ncbi:MAG: aminotransferase class I/II-fold pyridoxal phosphate-dependent enzyme [Polyangiaceae bacterium]